MCTVTRPGRFFAMHFNLQHNMEINTLDPKMHVYSAGMKGWQLGDILKCSCAVWPEAVFDNQPAWHIVQCSESFVKSLHQQGRGQIFEWGKIISYRNFFTPQLNNLLAWCLSCKSFKSGLLSHLNLFSHFSSTVAWRNDRLHGVIVFLRFTIKEVRSGLMQLLTTSCLLKSESFHSLPRISWSVLRVSAQVVVCCGLARRGGVCRVQSQLFTASPCPFALRAPSS